MQEIRLIDKGVIPYAEAWDFQKEIFEMVSSSKTSTDGYLIFCEHPHVYTLGKSGHVENLLVSDEFLKSINASFYKIDRGGDITYHGYGQIVGYPILSLEDCNISLKGYINILEQAVINTIAHFGISGVRIDGATGVWVENGTIQKKICAIGVKASRFITMHGFALNVNTDLNYFKYINPCGFTEKGVTSLKDILGREVDLNSVKDLFVKEFSALIGCNIKK
ncbi:MAG: lipoyl(octanoyl) transferase LipB [Rikenellaceae bacterium]